MNSLTVRSLWSALALCSLSLGGATFAQDASPSKLDKAESAYYKDLNIANKNYRKALAAALDDAVQAEIHLLDGEVVPLPKENNDPSEKTPLDPTTTFVVAPYHSTTKILKSRLVEGPELAKLLPHLKQTVGVEENTHGALCHEPIHGIRVWDKDHRILFESSFCYKCGNFYITYPNYGDSSAQWTGISQKEFVKIMIELMPFRQAEVDRSEKKKQE